jgi:ADP-ribose pyrophosphatase YjhB (NUDIX family)
MIGHGDTLLLVADDHDGHYRLPGGVIANGEPMEQTLRRCLHDQLDGATVQRLDFCAVIEDGVSTSAGDFASTLLFVFDVTLDDMDPLLGYHPTVDWWGPGSNLISVRPTIIRDRLTAGTLSVDTPWQPWPPERT